MIAIVQSILAALAGRTVTVSVAVGKPLVVEDAASQAVVPLTDEQAKARLIELLSDPKYKFRSFNRLAKAIGKERGQTEEYLAQIGARPAHRNGNLFALVSRVGHRQVA